MFCAYEFYYKKHIWQSAVLLICSRQICLQLVVRKRFDSIICNSRIELNFKLIWSESRIRFKQFVRTLPAAQSERLIVLLLSSLINKSNSTNRQKKIPILFYLFIIPILLIKNMLLVTFIITISFIDWVRYIKNNFADMYSNENIKENPLRIKNINENRTRTQIKSQNIKMLRKC